MRHEIGWSDIQKLSRLGSILLNVSKNGLIKAFPPRRKLVRMLDEQVQFSCSCTNTFDYYIDENSAVLKSLRANLSETDLLELIVHGISEL